MPCEGKYYWKHIFDKNFGTGEQYRWISYVKVMVHILKKHHITFFLDFLNRFFIYIIGSPRSCCKSTQRIHGSAYIYVATNSLLRGASSSYRWSNIITCNEECFVRLAFYYQGFIFITQRGLYAIHIGTYSVKGYCKTVLISGYQYFEQAFPNLWYVYILNLKSELLSMCSSKE